MGVRACATEIVSTLVRAGYIAYFAGGWVRDFIMKHPSDDIDIATSAPPEKIIELFPHTIKVGLAFGIVVVVLKGHQFEVATFRKDIGSVRGRYPEKIELSNPQEDALRRDFTINGMFYDPLKDSIYDYVHGREDIQSKVIRTIGDPHDRFIEDRLRMIRAIRFAARFGFTIDPATWQAIKENAHTLFPSVAMERVWQEFNKMAKSPRFDWAIMEMHRTGILGVIFPALKDLPIRAIEDRVAFFNQFPKGAPVILYLIELFPETALEELLELCQYLRTSVHEGKLVEFAHKGKVLLEQEETKPHGIAGIEWAYFYAHRMFPTAFDVIAARYPEEKRGVIIERHQKRRERLLPHVQRLVEKKPLVTAAILQDYGIPPGKMMGELLRAAEHAAITHDIHEAELVIELLKELPLWPKEHRNV
jgi:poly(A) polymerase